MFRGATSGPGRFLHSQKERRKTSRLHYIWAYIIVYSKSVAIMVDLEPMGAVS